MSYAFATYGLLGCLFLPSPHFLDLKKKDIFYLQCFMASCYCCCCLVYLFAFETGSHYPALELEILLPLPP